MQDTLRIKMKTPHAGQKQVLASKARYIVLLCGRRWGKSVVAQRKAITLLLQGKRVGYMTHKLSLARKFFKVICKLVPKGLVEGDPNKTDLYIETTNGGEIRFFSGEAPDNTRGHEFDYFIIDECASIPDLGKAWQEDIAPTLSIPRGGAMFIGTPNGRDFFYALFLRGKNGEHNFESFHFPSNTSPYFHPDEWEEKKRTMPSAQFKQEYEAEPMASQNNPFGEHIDKNVVTEFSKEPTAVYAADVASIGDYSVVIGLDKDGRMTYFDRFRKSWPETQKALLMLPQDVLLVVDATGVGENEVQRLQLERQHVIGFKFNTQSKPEIMFKLIGAVERGEVTYNDMVASEMKSFEMHRQSTGHIKFEAKKGYNDDCVMALAMANNYRMMAGYSGTWNLLIG